MVEPACMVDSIRWQRVAIDRSAIEGLDQFPLTLTAIERFFIWDHSAAYPKRFHIVVEFNGMIDDDKLITALAKAACRHPMLLAEVERYDRRWFIPQNPFIEVSINNFFLPHAGGSESRQAEERRQALRACTSPFTPLGGSSDSEGRATNFNAAQLASLVSIDSARNETTQPAAGARIAVFKQHGSTSIVFEADHAVTDGLGYRMYVEDAMSCYSALANDDESLQRWRALQPERLQHRGECPEPKAEDKTRDTTLREKLIHAFHFHFLHPFGVRYRDCHKDRTARSLEFRSFDFDLEGHTELKDYFKRDEVSLDEWSIANLIATIEAWQQKTQGRSKRIRISLPINLRTWKDMRLSASNKIGFAFVVSPGKSANCFNDLMNSVAQQLEMIRELCLGRDLVRLLEGFQFLGGVIRFVMARLRSLATAVITNVGDLTARQRKSRDDADDKTRIGGMKLNAIYCWPPIRRGTQIGIGLCRFDRRLSVGSLFDRTKLSEADIDELFQGYVDRLSSPVSKQ
jgi:NRPS condensation-like uncharacterized protein